MALPTSILKQISKVVSCSALFLKAFFSCRKICTLLLAPASPEELQRLQVAHVGSSQDLTQEIWNLGLGEVWSCEPRLAASVPMHVHHQTPARLQATTALGVRVITVALLACCKQHFLYLLKGRNLSNWILCAEEHQSLNTQCKCRTAVAVWFWWSIAQSLADVRGAVAYFQVESGLLSKNKRSSRTTVHYVP